MHHIMLLCGSAPTWHSWSYAWHHGRRRDRHSWLRARYNHRWHQCSPCSCSTQHCPSICDCHRILYACKPVCACSNSIPESLPSASCAPSTVLSSCRSSKWLGNHHHLPHGRTATDMVFWLGSLATPPVMKARYQQHSSHLTSPCLSRSVIHIRGSPSFAPLPTGPSSSSQASSTFGAAAIRAMIS